MKVLKAVAIMSILVGNQVLKVSGKMELSRKRN
jgi:hypothetical protein